MAYELLGKDFIPPDLRAKVTGKARYAEDFRVDGMVFCRLLTSPLPHARVRNIDASEALALPGVIGILTADEVPQFPEPENPILTNEPKYIGEPILAVAAVDEQTAHDALERINIDYEELPFTVDPLQSLYPGGPNARSDGNVAGPGIDIQTLKWTAEDFAEAGESRLPLGQAVEEWSWGDLDGGFESAALVLDETFISQNNSHHSMEPRTAMAYWENGKCYLHGSSQSQSFVEPGIARYIGIEPENLVFIAEFCGGGFGSKAASYSIISIPAHMSKKIGRPVMMRISRAEEYYLGACRSAFQGRVKIGFRDDGRITAVDLFIVQDNGPTTGFQDWRFAADCVSLIYQPQAMRLRAVPTMTNTPHRTAQRNPGRGQMVMAMEPIIDKAARQLGLDRVAIRKINAPDNDATMGRQQGPVTSAYLSEALDKGAAEFDWETKKQLSGQRSGSKVTGIGVGQSYNGAGSSGFDGIVRITPDGILHIHTGIGNLGTFSHTSTSRAAAEVLKYSWDNCIVERGDTRRGLPWNIGQFASNSSYTMTRTNYAASMDALAKLKEIAAMDLGGAPEDYDIGDEKVFSTSEPDKNMTYATAAQRAIELGGKYSGHEVPDDINEMTRRSALGLAGTGLIGVAKDNLDHRGTVPSLAAGFMHIELDVETGKFEILEYVGIGDCGTVHHPQSLQAQIKAGGIWGIGISTLERQIYDPQTGLPASVSYLQQKPATYLDVPSTMHVDAVGLPDLYNPFGIKGIGEVVVGSAASALLCAISDALGGHYFYRSPVVTDMIVNAAAGRPQSHKPLQTHTA